MRSALGNNTAVESRLQRSSSVYRRTEQCGQQGTASSTTLSRHLRPPSPLTKGLSRSLLQSFLSCFSLSTAIPLIAKRTFALSVFVSVSVSAVSLSLALALSPKRTVALGWLSFKNRDREAFLSRSKGTLEGQQQGGALFLCPVVFPRPVEVERCGMCEGAQARIASSRGHRERKTHVEFGEVMLFVDR